MLRQWTVDAFASQPFKGNPACVVEPFAAWPSDGWMQALAQENNQAETAFLVRTGDASRLQLRWFTPAMEVPFCGHATLGAAHVLVSELGVSAPEIVFETRHRGEFRVRREGETYRLDFPADPPRPVEAPPELERALGASVRECWAGQYLLAIIDDEATVRGLKPDIAAIQPLGAELADSGRGNLIVCALADATSPYDVVSRFFAPGSGVPEDPTTGSAHTILGPLFTQKLGRSRLRYHQAFPGRGGDLEVEVSGGRAIVYGAAVTVMETKLRLSAA